MDAAFALTTATLGLALVGALLPRLNKFTHGSQSVRPARRRRRRARNLRLEHLEDRTVPATFVAANVSDLIADIDAANLSGEANTIALVAGTTFELDAVNNTTDGATGLPIIAANNNLTIIGNGDTIARSASSGTPAFRLLDVAPGATLVLSDMTLQGGLALGLNVAAEGGAVLNRGTVNMSGVIVQGNTAQTIPNGIFAGRCAGGGIYSSGLLTAEGCTIQNNQAVGANGNDGSNGGGDGGGAVGGGIAIVGGSATLTNLTVASNSAKGGNGGKGGHGKLSWYAPDGTGGSGLGGGIYVGPGIATLTGCTVKQNTAAGGNGSVNGESLGGGIYIAPSALVMLDGSTVSDTNHNHATTGGPDIYGSYILI
jgi:hypothetical protein